MRKLFFSILALSAPLMANWSASLEWFPLIEMDVGTVHGKFTVVEHDAGTVSWLKDGHLEYRGKQSWRLGAAYERGPFVGSAKYLFSDGQWGRKRNGMGGRSFYNSSTARAGFGGWLWRFYFEGRALARHTGYRQDMRWGALPGLETKWKVQRLALDGAGAGLGGTIHLRVWRGLGLGFEIDGLANYVWADVRGQGAPFQEALQYERWQPGADAQLYLQYHYKGKKRGVRCRLGSYAEGMAFGNLRLGNEDAVSSGALTFGGLLIDLGVDF